MAKHDNSANKAPERTGTNDQEATAGAPIVAPTAAGTTAGATQTAGAPTAQPDLSALIALMAKLAPTTPKSAGRANPHKAFSEATKAADGFITSTDRLLRYMLENKDTAPVQAVIKGAEAYARAHPTQSAIKAQEAGQVAYLTKELERLKALQASAGQTQ